MKLVGVETCWNRNNYKSGCGVKASCEDTSRCKICLVSELVCGHTPLRRSWFVGWYKLIGVERRSRKQKTGAKTGGGRPQWPLLLKTAKNKHFEIR